MIFINGDFFLWLYNQLAKDLCNQFTPMVQGYFTDTGAIIWLPQYQWSNPEQYGYNDLVSHHNESQQSTKTVCTFLQM